MFARFLGRQASSTPTQTTTKGDDRPEVDEVDNNNNKEQQSIQTIISIEENNQVKSDKAAALASVPQEIEKPIVSDDIQLDILETHKGQNPPLPLKAAAGWIAGHTAKTAWPLSMQDAVPRALLAKWQEREVKGKSIDDRMNEAASRRAAILNGKQEALFNYHNRIAYSVCVAQDLEDNSLRNKVDELDARMIAAEERRQANLDEKRLQAALSTVAIGFEGDEIDTQSTNRMEKATRYRNAAMQYISKRAGKAVEYARLVATEVAAADEEASEIVKELSEQRLQRAEVRRNIQLDRIRLSCGRHGNYVQSVYLTNRYMERRSSQMIQHNLDAATFRRDVKLEEIKSNARQQNLSAQFKACCAYRLLDAKWLNYALKNTAAQTSAKMRRDQALEAEQQRLHEANVRRADVLAKYKWIQSEKRDMEYLESKMNAAAYRREMHLYERRAIIQEREAIIRGRKLAAETITRRKGRQAIINKLEAAFRRRNIFLEKRRSVCATRNWHARVMAHRQEEVQEEESQVALQSINDKLNAAKQRRIEYQYPIFSELVALRGQRAKQVLLAQDDFKRRVYERKEAFDKVHKTSMNQKKMSRTHERLTRFKQVESNRKFMDTFYKQVISNTITARQRGADLRRALYQDAIIANASETVDRSAAARDRLEFQEEEARELLDIKMSNAEARRLEARDEKVATALWFQGKVIRAQQRENDFIESKREEIEEAAANASLRRSIFMTQKLQSNALRKYRWHEKQKQIMQENYSTRAEQEIKASQAEARRDANLLQKIEIARNTSNRVSVARLEKRAEDVVDAAIRTAITKTMSKNAEERRQAHLTEIQSVAASEVKYAKGISEYQKSLREVRAEVVLEQSKLRILQTSKRRENLMTQRKLGYSTMEQLQPYAGLTVIGHAMSLTA